MVLKYHLTEDGCNPNIEIKQRVRNVLDLCLFLGDIRLAPFSRCFGDAIRWCEGRVCADVSQFLHRRGPSQASAHIGSRLLEPSATHGCIARLLTCAILRILPIALCSNEGR